MGPTLLEIGSIVSCSGESKASLERLNKLYSKKDKTGELTVTAITPHTELDRCRGGRDKVYSR